MLPLFNTTAGPYIPGERSMLPPERRLGAVLELVEAHRYLTLHAGRQTGKTTSARWMVRHLNAGDRFCKLRRDTETEEEALDQPVRYLDHAGLPEGWLVLLDLRTTTRWAERLSSHEVEHRGKRVHVVGC